MVTNTNCFLNKNFLLGPFVWNYGIKSCPQNLVMSHLYEPQNSILSDTPNKVVKQICVANCVALVAKTSYGRQLRQINLTSAFLLDC